MLTYNYRRVFSARGISQPYTFLRRAGFSNDLAYKISHNKAKNLRTYHLEKLCLILYCTPEDLMDWSPGVNSSIPKDHPIRRVTKYSNTLDIHTLRTIPMDKLEAVYKNLQKIMDESDN